jgi:DNA-binding response OmpR family regulator
MTLTDKPTILVVEDDDQTAVFIRYFLEQEGFLVRHAADGKEAEEFIATQPAPSLVTLDIDLPHARGDDLMLNIKTREGWERVPVVMVTATPKSGDQNWAIRKGAKGYLVKPFEPAALLDCVRALLAKKA